MQNKRNKNHNLEIREVSKLEPLESREFKGGFLLLELKKIFKNIGAILVVLGFAMVSSLAVMLFESGS